MDLLEMTFKGAVGAVAATVGWTVKQGIQNKEDIRALQTDRESIHTSLEDLKSGQRSVNEKLDRLIQHLLEAKE